MKKFLLASATAAVMVAGLPTTASAFHCNFTGTIVRIDHSNLNSINIYAKQGGLNPGTALFVTSQYPGLPDVAETAAAALASQTQVFFSFGSSGACTDFSNPSVQQVTASGGITLQVQ